MNKGDQPQGAPPDTKDQCVQNPAAAVPGVMILGVPAPRPSIAGQGDRPSRRSMLKQISMQRTRVSDGGDRQSRLSKVMTPVMDTFTFRGMNMSEKVKECLRKFDVNDDDELDIAEVTALVEHLLSEEQQNKQLRFAILFLAIFTCVLLAGMFGLTWAVVAALKDTKVGDDATLRTKAGVTVQIASVDYSLGSGGAMIPRNTTAGSGIEITREDGSVFTTNATNSVRTAVYQGTKIANITSLIRIQSLMELNHLYFVNNEGGEMALRVMGVARVKKWDSVWGSIVKIVTTVGTVELDDTKISFDEAIAPIFSEAGFATKAAPGARRRMLEEPSNGGGTASGLFNHVNQDGFTPNTVVWSAQDLANIEKIRARGGELARLLQLQGEGGDTTAQSDLLAAWSRYVRTFEKENPTEEEYTARFNTFLANLAYVASINTDPTSSFWAGGNYYTDLTWEEFLAKVIAGNSPPPGFAQKAAGTRRMGRRLHQALPSQIDWRARGMVTPPRSQGSCGCCWAFASVAAVESAVLIANAAAAKPNANITNTTLDLSDSQVAFCANPANGYADSNGCSGGTPLDGLMYVYQNGITTEAKLPYNTSTVMKVAADRTCKVSGPAALTEYQNAGALVKLAEEPGWVDYNSEAALKAAVAVAPAVSYVNINPAFQAYAGGVFDATKCTTALNHLIAVVGYNDTGRYWIIKNSWGAGWGEGGYIRLPYTGDNEGACGLQMFAFAVNPKFSALSLKIDAPKVLPTARAGTNTTSTQTKSSGNATTKAKTGGKTRLLM